MRESLRGSLISQSFIEEPRPWKIKKIWRERRKRQTILERDNQHANHFIKTNHHLMKSKQLEIFKALIVGYIGIHTREPVFRADCNSGDECERAQPVALENSLKWASSDALFSFFPQSFPASGSFPMSRMFTVDYIKFSILMLVRVFNHK